MPRNLKTWARWAHARIAQLEAELAGAAENREHWRSRYGKLVEDFHREGVDIQDPRVDAAGDYRRMREERDKAARDLADHLFFAAMTPEQREEYAARRAAILREAGLEELI